MCTNWKAGYLQEVENSIEYYNWLNKKQPVKTRQMTEEEFKEVFGEKRESCHRLKVKNNNGT